MGSAEDPGARAETIASIFELVFGFPHGEQWRERLVHELEEKKRVDAEVRYRDELTRVRA